MRSGDNGQSGSPIQAGTNVPTLLLSAPWDDCDAANGCAYASPSARAISGNGAGHGCDAAGGAIPPELYPRYAAAIAETSAKYDPARDREFSIELLLAGIEAPARWRTTPAR